MLSAPRVIHTGQALVDLVAEVPELPGTGGNVMARSANLYAGGSVNVLVAAARQGARAVHAGAHGVGPNGDLIRHTLAAEGVSLSQQPRPGRDTGVCVVLVEPSGERSFVTTRGAERELSVAGLQTCAPRPGDVVCVTGYTLLDPTKAALLPWLEQLPPGSTVVFDPGEVFATLPEQVRSAMLARTTVWTSNASEAADLTGEDDPRRAAKALADLVPSATVVVVRDGADGCYLHHDGLLTPVPGYPQRPVDTNGAGDAHVGVMVAELAAGLDPVAAARRANAAGAVKVTRRGPATAPTRDEVDAFLAESSPSE